MCFFLFAELCSICQLTTEFHFPPIDEQLEKIRDDVKEAVAWRQAHHRDGSDPQVYFNEIHACVIRQSKFFAFQQMKKSNSSKALQTGDVFITRHSNLAQVHVVFHMVVNDSLRSGDINSRHPVILGLRNILKTACCNDITTLTIPVLLVHEMTEVRVSRILK